MLNTVAHDRGSRKIDVVIDIEANADLASVSSEISAILAKDELPFGHHAQLLGEHQARTAARNRLGLAGGAAFIGTILVLLADFRSIRLASWQPSVPARLSR